MERLNFTLIKSGEDFEFFCEDLLRAKGLFINSRVFRGPDSGADIVASISTTDGLGFNVESRILVECKHFAQSNRSVRETHLGNIIERTILHNCNKYLLITSTLPSSTVAQQLKAISSNPSIPITANFWSKNDLENYLVKLPDLIDKYFNHQRNPESINNEKALAQVIAVHLHPDLSSKLIEVLDIWNSTQERIKFVPIRPPREQEHHLLSIKPLSCETADSIADEILDISGFDVSDGLMQFCEGRLFDEGYYQLFSNTCRGERKLGCSTISLNMKRQLVQGCSLKAPIFSMVLQSMLACIGFNSELNSHKITRTCIMDFNNEMADILLGLKKGPKFCPSCEKILRKRGDTFLLELAKASYSFIHGDKDTSSVTRKMGLREQRRKEIEDSTYEIALSFAGEDRGYAQKLALKLKEKDVTVFYDDFEKDRLWGEDLYSYLDELYRFRAKYCVVFLSKHYSNKLWTNHERRSMQAKAFTESQPYLLPIRLDDTEIKGIPTTIGYINWNDQSVEFIVELLVKKLKNTI